VDGFLSTFRLSSLPGAAYAYSNLGFGLLADLLSDREGESFNQLVHDQIAGPLGMNHTEVTLSAGQVLNPGYSAGFSTLPDFASERLYDFTDQSGLAGAAAVHSTVNDLLTYISDEMASEMKAPFQGDLADAMALSLVPRFSHAPDIRPLAVALGWEILVDHDIIFHSGDLPGFDSFIGFNPITGVGVVILSNTSMYQFDSTTQGGQLVYYDQSTDLGMQILFSQN
jgi:D-alanyl-D-alanine-carboxypeptidase/D-alanyl-D-alanine-endopeptidase